MSNRNYSFSDIDWAHKQIDHIYTEQFNNIRIVAMIGKQIGFPIFTDDIKRFKSACGMLERMATEDRDDGVRRAAKETMVSLLNLIVRYDLVKDLVEVDSEFVAWFIDQKHKYCAEDTEMEL